MVSVLLIIGVILLVLWLLGLIGTFALGPLIWVALVIGLILLISGSVGLVRRRRR